MKTGQLIIRVSKYVKASPITAEQYLRDQFSKYDIIMTIAHQGENQTMHSSPLVNIKIQYPEVDNYDIDEGIENIPVTNRK